MSSFEENSTTPEPSREAPTSAALEKDRELTENDVAGAPEVVLQVLPRATPGQPAD